MSEKQIQVFSNSLGSQELNAVKRVFDSKWLFHGNEQKLFEENFGNKIKSKKFLFTNGCTNSIHMCLQALDIKRGDEVIMPSNSFISCPASVKMLGGTPIFCDIEKETNNIDINSCKEKITKKTKAVIILHYGGYPCKFDELKEIVKDMRGFFTENRITNIAFCGFGANSQSYPTHADAMDVLLLQVVGDCDITVDNEDRTMRPGDIVYIPRGTNHHIQPTMSRVTYSFGVEGDADPSDYIGRP